LACPLHGYSPAPTQRSLLRQLQTQLARYVQLPSQIFDGLQSTVVQLVSHSSQKCNFDDNDGEEAACSPSLHKKEILYCKYNDDDDDPI
jgi:hypothetical protein